MNHEEKPDLSKWTIKQLVNSLTAAQLWGVLGSLALVLVGVFWAGVYVGKIQASTPTTNNIDKESTVDAEFMISRKRAYDTAMAMIDEVAKASNTTESILNIRSGGTVPEEDRLYTRIIEEARKGDILYTRAASYESDSKLEITQRFLNELGEKKNVRVIVTAGSPTVPSCFITDTKALLGFKADDGTINHGLYIKGPETLVQDIKTMYQKILNDKDSAYTIKEYGDVIPKDKVNDVITSLRNELSKRTRNYSTHQHAGDNLQINEDAKAKVTPVQRP